MNLLRETLYCSVSKNGEPNTVPLLENLKAALIPCMRGKGPEAWLFTHEDGSQVKGYRKAWVRVLKAAGLNPGLHFHDLRRTARVAMADHNIDERWAMNLMGHKTRSCSERYNIVNTGTRRKAAAMLAQPAAQPAREPRAKGSRSAPNPRRRLRGRVRTGIVRAYLI